MHGEFHIDAFVVFFALAFVATTVIRVLFNRAAKYIQHTIWMRRRAKGTLIKDAEADYWVKLIARPDYKPIGRWFYAEQWKKKHGQGGVTASNGKPRRLTLKRLLYLNIAIAIAVAAIFLVAVVKPGSLSGFVPDIPTTTRLDVMDVWNATNIYAGKSEMTYRALSTMTPNVVFFLTLARTDGAPSFTGERDVFFNLQSGSTSNLIGRDVQDTYYILNATYYFQSGLVMEVRSDYGQFGLPMKLGVKDSILFAVVIYLRDYSALPPSFVLFTMTSTGGETKITLETPTYVIPTPV